MVDIVSPEVRSRMMAGISGKNTRPEMLVRHGLHSRGFRYLLHYRKLPGKPDLVFPKYHAVFFLNGCFWHGHDCSLFKWPSTRAEFWQRKIEGNKRKDKETIDALRRLGWRVLVIWECTLKGKGRLTFESIIDQSEKWLRSDNVMSEIRGLV